MYFTLVLLGPSQSMQLTDEWEHQHLAGRGRATGPPTCPAWNMPYSQVLFTFYFAFIDQGQEKEEGITGGECQFPQFYPCFSLKPK